jgi:uncharacterized protein YciI
MPRYLCYCPDYPDNLEKRLSVREAHLAMGQADKDSGAQRESLLSHFAGCHRERRVADDSLRYVVQKWQQHMYGGRVWIDVSVFGSPFLPQPGTTARERPPADVVNGQKPNLAGSVMVYQLDSLEAMWDRLKRDPYWEAGVWDRERLTVEELYN